MNGIEITKKQSRLKKQQKKKYAKSSGTLGGQVKRTKAAGGYQKNKKTDVDIKIKNK